jgi:hypothetical protein
MSAAQLLDDAARLVDALTGDGDEAPAPTRAKRPPRPPGPDTPVLTYAQHKDAKDARDNPNKEKMEEWLKREAARALRDKPKLRGWR